MNKLYWGKRKRINNSEEEQEEEPSKKAKSSPYNGLDDSSGISTNNNHIYFYCSVNKKNCKKLNIALKNIAQEIMSEPRNFVDKDKYIYLHINSFGGSVFACFSTIDTILSLPIPVVSIVEGAAASAGTLISVACNYRIIHGTSFMLIHQLSSGTWGKMADIEDEVENLQLLMKTIKDIYKKHTKLRGKQLDDILKRDMWWDADTCLEKGLVDEIRYTEDKMYEVDKNKIRLD